MIFPRIEVHAVDHCTLSCVGCNHASPLLKKKSYNVEDYFPWLDILQEKDCNWSKIGISGGEPFILGEKINHFISYLRKRYGGHIELFSNAFWLDNEDNIEKYAECFSQLDELILSFYDPYVEKIGWETIQKRVDLIRSKFQLKISSFQVDCVKGFGQFLFLDKAVPVSPELKCVVKDCTQLRTDGIMYRCTYGHYLNTVVASDGFKKGTDIIFDLKKPFTTEEFDLWINKWPLDNCSFCGCGQGRIAWTKWESDPKIKNMDREQYEKKVKKLIKKSTNIKPKIL